MCYSGKCKYEQYFGDCSLPHNETCKIEERATVTQQPLSGSPEGSPKLKKLQEILRDYKNDVYGHETFSVTKCELESFLTSDNGKRCVK